jgi:cell division protein FtsI (penicillin-binding protein 3)
VKHEEHRPLPPVHSRFKTLRTLLSRVKNKYAKVPLSSQYDTRIRFLGGCTATVMGLLLARYAYLAVLPTDMRGKLRNQATRQFETEIKLAPPRAAIIDRTGRPLAVSILRPSVFAIPRRMPKDLETLQAVSKKTGVALKQLQQLTHSRKSFAWLKRQLTEREVEKLGDIAEWHEFLGIIDEPKRVYPEKELAAHLIGFVGIDNAGLEGAESIFNTRLSGESVTVKVTRDARGRITLTTPNGAVKPEPSVAPLRLSIDLSIQSFAEAALRDGILKARAKGGSAVVMDVETGEVMAIASYPTYDLNNPPENEPEKRRFRPVMDALELGSVVKPLFIAYALDRGLVKKNEMLFCENGSMRVPGGQIRDDHPRGWITPGDVIKYSSNICTYKIVQRMGRKTFAESLVRVGLARGPATGLPGEWQGRISAPETWREMRFSNMTFGQGIAISPLQLTHSHSILTGGGLDKGVKLLAKSNTENELVGPELRYISQATSRMVTEMMATVVEEEGGTGKRASIPGVTVAGKTGTAQKFKTETNSYSERIASFVGVVPAEKPKLAITVVIDEPQVRPAYGGLLAGPVFSEIGSKTLRYLNSQGLVNITFPEETPAPL